MNSNLEKLKNTPFYLGDYKVDAKRGLVSTKQGNHAVERKVMLVLLILSDNAGDVVEQEALFNQVWPNSIFSPNSLRRCISELRKIFNDKDKALFCTHPKIGYSLNTKPQIKKQRAFLKPSLFIAVLFITAVLAIQQLSLQNSKPINIVDMQPITATEALEDFITVSPDETWLAFVRLDSNKTNNGKVWLKHLSSLKEIEVPLPSRHRRNLFWSRQENSIYYVQINKVGWQIRKLSLNLEADSAQHIVIKDKKIFEHSYSHRVSSIAVDKDENLYFIANERNTKTLYQLNIDTTELEYIIIGNTQFEPYDLALSGDQSTLAVTGHNDQNTDYVKLINLRSMELETFKLSENQRFDLQWMNQDRNLLLNNGRRLFQFDLATKTMSSMGYEQSQFIRFTRYSPLFNSIYLVTSKLDTDLMITTNKGEQITIADSTAMDYFPVISPNNQYVAYYSTRHGKPQLFLYNLKTNETSLLFDNPNNHLNVDRAVWASTSEKLAFSLGNQIYTIYLNENNNEHKANLLQFKGRVVDWFSNDRGLLIAKNSENSNKLSRINIETNEENKY